jgi:hypothetical protein
VNERHQHEAAWEAWKKARGTAFERAYGSGRMTMYDVIRELVELSGGARP